jgi:hypothetical protein
MRKIFKPSSITLRLGLSLILVILASTNIAARPSDINLIVRVSDCMSNASIKGAYVEVPTAAKTGGSASSNYTDDKGVARIYPLRFGGQVHEIRIQALGYMPRSQSEQMKPWASVEANVCLIQIIDDTSKPKPNIMFIRWSEKFPVPIPPLMVEECQCVTYWSRSEIGRVLGLGVAGLSPDLMIKLNYFSQIPNEYGNWNKQNSAHSGDTIIILPDAFMYLYSFTGRAYTNYTQLRPGHIGIIESAEYLDGVSIDLVGKHYDAFRGWHVRLRNTNWPSEWMENNRYYAERVGNGDHEMVCKNVGVSEIIIPENTELISYWGRE